MIRCVLRPLCCTAISLLFMGAPVHAQENKLGDLRQLIRELSPAPAPAKPARAKLTLHRGEEESDEKIEVEFRRVRAQAEDWLRDTGLELIKGRDHHGKRVYTLLSGEIQTRWLTFYMRGRVGRPELFAGLRHHRKRPAFGLVVPLRGFDAELEAFEDKDLGITMLGKLQWRAGRAGMHYGVAVPLSFEQGASVGALAQVSLRWR